MWEQKVVLTKFPLKVSALRSDALHKGSGAVLCSPSMSADDKCQMQGITAARHHQRVRPRCFYNVASPLLPKEIVQAGSQCHRRGRVVIARPLNDSTSGTPLKEFPQVRCRVLFIYLVILRLTWQAYLRCHLFRRQSD